MKNFKKIILVAALFAALPVFAQDLEEMPDSEFYNQNGNSVLFVEVKKPFDFYKDPSCSLENYKRAQFPGGDVAYAKLLGNNILKYIDQEKFQLKGTFFIKLSINSLGEVIGYSFSPKVRNSDYFYEDLKFTAGRISGKWKPATCDGTAVSSKLRIRLDFNSENIEN